MSFLFHFFGDSDKSDTPRNRKGSEGPKKRRLRVEPLESREMLSISTLDVDTTFSPDFIETTDVETGVYAPEASDATAMAAAIPGSWDVKELTTQSDSFKRGWGSGIYTGSFTLTLYHDGDKNSYIKLYDTKGGDQLSNKNTYIKIGDKKVTGESVTFSLEGYARGTYNVEWGIEVKWLNSTVPLDIVVNPPVAPPTITTHPVSADYLPNAAPKKLRVEATTDGYPGSLSYQWQRSTNGLTWTNVSGQTSSDFRFSEYTPSTSTIGTSYYRCVVMNSRDGHITSTPSKMAKIVVTALPDDKYEDNDTFETAANLVTGEATSNTLKTVDSGKWDHNLLKPTNNKSGSFTFKMDHTGNAGSYVELWAFMSGLGQVNGDSYLVLDGEKIFINGGKNTNEGRIRISLEGKAAGTHTVEWYLHATAWGTMNYSIATGLPETSSAITTQFHERGLRCNDDDWYKFTIGRTGDTDSHVKINYSDDLGSLKLALYKNKGMVLRSSETSNNGVQSEQSVSLANLSPGTYYILVSGHNSGEYELTVNPPVERNDTFETAALLSAPGSTSITHSREFLRKITTYSNNTGKGYFSFTIDSPGDETSFIAINTKGIQNADVRLYDAKRNELDKQEGPSLFAKTIDVYTRTTEGGQTRETLGGYDTDYWEKYNDHTVGIGVEGGVSEKDGFSAKISGKYEYQWGNSWGNESGTSLEKELTEQWGSEASTSLHFDTDMPEMVLSLNGLPAGTYYLYIYGEEVYTDQTELWVNIGITPPPVTSPIILPGIAITAEKANSVSLSWNVVDTYAEKYLLEVQDVSSGKYLMDIDYVVTKTADGFTATVTGLNSGTEYRFLVTAINSLGMTALPTQSATTLSTAPDTPSNFRVTDQTASSINLSWAPVTDATSYTLQRSDNGTSGWSTVYTGVNTTYSNTGLTAGRTYYYRVKASSTGGESDWATTSAETDKLTLTSLSTSTDSPQVGVPITVTLTPNNATATYQWYRGSTQSNVTTAIFGATSNTYTPTTADVGYYLKAVATGTGNYTGTASRTLTNVVKAALTSITPSTNSPKVGVPITTTLAPTGATATYQWFRGSTSNNVTTAISGATSNTYTPTAADVGYYLKAVATGTGNYTGTASRTLTNVVAPVSQDVPTNKIFVDSNSFNVAPGSTFAFAVKHELLNTDSCFGFTLAISFDANYLECIGNKITTNPNLPPLSAPIVDNVNGTIVITWSGDDAIPSGIATLIQNLEFKLKEGVAFGVNTKIHFTLSNQDRGFESTAPVIDVNSSSVNFDLDGDGTFDKYDALAFLRYANNLHSYSSTWADDLLYSGSKRNSTEIAGLLKTHFTDTKRFDLDGDGACDKYDALILLRYANNLHSYSGTWADDLLWASSKRSGSEIVTYIASFLPVKPLALPAEANSVMENIAPTFVAQSPAASELVTGETLYWDIKAVTSPQAPIMNWSINWGDDSENTNILGGPRNSVAVTHFYGRPGEYSVTATTTDVHGVVSSAVIGTYVITESDSSPPIQAPIAAPLWQEDFLEYSHDVLSTQSDEISVATFLSTQDVQSTQWSFDVKTDETTLQRHMIDLDQRAKSSKETVATTDYLLGEEDLFEYDFADLEAEEAHASSSLDNGDNEIFANILEIDWE